MSYYRTCSHCGAHLDPGERCDCRGALRTECRKLIMELTDEQVELVFAGIKLHDQHPNLSVEECVEAVVKRRE